MTERADTRVDLNVLVVGNDPVLRRGIAQYLELISLSSRLGEASLEESLTEAARAVAWDLIALDLQGGGQLAILERLKKAWPDIPVLVLDIAMTTADRQAAMAAGADGCLDKNWSAQEWREAFETVAAGGRYFHISSP